MACHLNESVLISCYMLVPSQLWAIGRHGSSRFHLKVNTAKSQEQKSRILVTHGVTSQVIGYQDGCSAVIDSNTHSPTREWQQSEIAVYAVCTGQCALMPFASIYTITGNNTITCTGNNTG